MMRCSQDDSTAARVKMNASNLSTSSDRGLGRIIDFVIYIVFGGIVGFGADQLGMSLVATQIIVAVALFAGETFMVANSGASIGKQLIGEKITDRNGQPVTLATAALRTTPRLLYVHPYGALIAVALGAVSAAMIYATEQRRSVMDVVAKTSVVRSPRS